jgi:hypothetical protein
VVIGVRTIQHPKKIRRKRFKGVEALADESG